MSRADTLRCKARLQRSGRGQQFRLDVDLEFPPGISILFGPSGSGKSTTLQAIAGLQRPAEGYIALGNEAWFDSKRKLDRAVHKRHVAYVFQSLALFPHMSAARNVAYGLDRSLDRAARRTMAQQSLDRLGVGHLADRRPTTFSGGEAQRVALARALAMKPRVILLDEPFSALDRDLRVQLAGLVRTLVDELEVPLIQVTHNHGEARALGDRIFRMEEGQVVQRGTAAEVFGDARGILEARSRAELIGDIGKTPMPELKRR
ncbi:MAG TPA: ABC transporter ATP-binding protein [Kofleriaceae bacterium]|nr:ABC transporter ATP-binding protein [Kofleriaceae bacterium]